MKVWVDRNATFFKHLLVRMGAKVLGPQQAKSDDLLLKNFGQWGLTIFGSVVLFIGIWVGLKTYFLSQHDGFAFALIGSGINIGVLCISKSIILAPSVRGSLCRAFTVGERLEALAERQRSATNTSTP